MNTVLSALAETVGVSPPLSTVLLTPRFRASRHVVALLHPQGSTEPVVVAKIPRLAGDAGGVEREHAVLTAVQAARENGYATIPRIVAFREVGGHAVLVETALVGVPLTPERARRDPARATAIVLRWLEELPTHPPRAPGETYGRLIEEPLGRFRAQLPAERDLVDRTLALVEPLRQASLPSVVEHGDLSHPNLLTLADGALGVVDWELAEVEGVPTHDLFYFLGFLAAARSGSSTPLERTRALHEALLRPGGWARKTVADYAAQADIDLRLLAPLLVACFARYTVGLYDRLRGLAADDASALRDEAAHLVRTDRHYSFWAHTVAHAADASWADEV